MKIFTSASLFFFLCLLALPAQDSSRYSPYTLDSFMGEYGFVPRRTEAEPRITSEENELLIQVKKLSVDELPAAIQLLQNKIQGDPACVRFLILPWLLFSFNAVSMMHPLLITKLRSKSSQPSSVPGRTSLSYISKRTTFLKLPVVS